MYKLTISIPTKNRPEFIEYYLNTINSILNFNIAIYIVDNSDDDLTENISKKYKKNYKNIYYKRLPSDTSLDEKCYNCIYNEIDSEYIWLCGDKIVVNKNIIEILFDHYLDKEYSLIVLSQRDNKNLGILEYNAITDLFKDCAWDMTLFGSTIINRKNVLKKDLNYYKSKYKDNLFSLQFYFDCNYVINKFIYLPYNFFTTNKYENGSFWKNEVFDTFIDKWINFIYLLPEKYNDYKVQVIKDHGIYSKLFTYRTFINHRMSGNMDYKVFLKYRSKFTYVTNVNRFYLFILCITPLNLLNFIKKLKEGCNI